MNKEPKIFEELKRLASLVPAAFYWTDANLVFRGINQFSLKIIGNLSEEDIIGKNSYDLYPEETAKIIVEHAKEVMETRKTLIFEESINDLTTGKTRYYNAIRAPLIENGEVVGIVGTTFEITAEKEVCRLEIEAELQKKKTKLEENEKFEEIVKKVAHDICSPLASLKMYLQINQNELSEKTRLAFTSAIDDIKGTADGILGRYKKDSAENLKIIDMQQPTILSLLLSQINGEKKYEYQTKSIEFNLKIVDNNTFTSAKISPLSFKHMISNLVNNAVDAFNRQEGAIINLYLDSDVSQVKIIVEDNGKGMPQEIIQQILNNKPVSSGKENGHGIGMIQIHDALRKDNGNITIDSKIEKGTKITLTYPKTEPPEWLPQKITLKEGDTVIILDDEQAIHDAWDIRLKEYEPKITIKHFISGEKTEEFINHSENKEKLLLLSDYQLLKQNSNGLEVIENTKIARAILVTSYHTDHKILHLADKLKVKTLPKPLAADIPVEII